MAGIGQARLACAAHPRSVRHVQLLPLLDLQAVRPLLLHLDTSYILIKLLIRIIGDTAAVTE